jgi:hypothetical protein
MSDTEKTTESIIEKERITARTLIVYELILKGYRRQEILREFTNKLKIKVTIHSIDKYIQKANVLFKKYAKTKTESQMGKAMSRLEMLYKKNMDRVDYEECLKVQKEINKLMGLITNNVDIKSAGEKIPATNVYFVGKDDKLPSGND